MKTLPSRKATGSKSRSKQKKWQRGNKVLFNNPRDFDIFALLLAIIMQYLLDYAILALKVWVSFKLFALI